MPRLKKEEKLSRLRERYPDYTCSRCNRKFKRVDEEFNVIPKTNYLRRFVVILNGIRISVHDICLDCSVEGGSRIRETLKLWETFGK